MGIDIGTSGCKALVFDHTGAVLSKAYCEYPLLETSPGYAEIDSNLLIDCCFAVIKTAAARAPEAVTALGISSQGEAFTALDSDGNFLCNAMVSSDARAAEIAREFPRQFGLERLYNITGHTPHPMFSLFKLIHLKQNQRQVWERAARFCCCEDLLQYKLGVENPAMAWSLAGRTMLFDIKKHCWSPEILAAVGLDAKQLSRALPPGGIAGKVAPRMAEELGLAADTLVVTGGHDQTCAALGAGVVDCGEAMLASGTVECIGPVIESAVFSKELRDNQLCTYDYALPGVFSTVAFSLTGGNIFKWFRDNLAGEDAAQNPDIYAQLLKSLPDAPSGLDVLPYFTPSGTPYFDLDTPGAIIGLRLSTSRAEILKGLLEAVALEMRLNLEILNSSGIRINKLVAVGGGAKSDILVQLKADVLNLPICCVEEPEAGCKAVALLAMAAATGQDPKNLVRAWIKRSKQFTPDRQKAAIYKQKFARYQKLYPLIKQFAGS